MEERIERQVQREGYDLETDEGATEYQRRIDIVLERRRATVKISDLQTVPKIYGIMI